ncbi:MAG: 2OG-Fe(II) oxygenase family protein [Alphaproteobacteria bacterium]|jgi:uncharacterized protein (TIGR02466 family)|nr:2OG-Fe(II) oxygenase family protein [Alphaproteobacteria bacterium]
MELKFDSRTDMVNAFATPFFLFQLDDSERLNAALKALILDKERSNPGVRRSNIGGWHSEDDLFSWNDRAIDALRQAALGAVQAVVPLMIGGDCDFQVTLAGWANVSRTGAYNKRHTHPGCQVSAVYYVEAGSPPTEDAPESGTFEFIDPRPHAEMSALPGEAIGRPMTIQPLNGRMILFPSWLYHQVNPYLGEAERISISFNAHVSNLVRS